MNKIVPFSKEIPFKTRIAEITDIEVTHNLEKTNDNTIEGNFLVIGNYKMTEATQIEEKFNHELPFIIEVDEKYDLEDLKIKISDFYFEIINEDVLRINIEVELSELKEKELVLDRCFDDEEKDDKIQIDDIKIDLENVEPIDILDVEIPKVLDVKNKEKEDNVNVVSSKSVSEIFTSINHDEDNFMTYSVYIVRENDVLDDILNKYKLTREEISEYNDLSNIKVGTKLILPCATNE